MNVLVLGGCGFIGSHLVDCLLNSGHRVRVMDHSTEIFREPLPGVDYRLAELSDRTALAAAVSGMDTVFHTVSTSLPESSNREPEADIRGNLINMLHLLDMMRASDVKRIVYLSSGGTVYGNADVVPTPETHLTNPVCSYGIVKLAIEKYLFMYQQLYGLQPVIIRPANPYGPRQNPTGIQGAISSFMSCIMRQQPVHIWGDGSIIRDFFHVEDLAGLCVLAGESSQTGIFNAGSGSGCSIRSLIDIIAAASGMAPRIEFEQARSFDVRNVVLDIHKAETSFGWKPGISLKHGISSYWQWMTEHQGRANQ